MGLLDKFLGKKESYFLDISGGDASSTPAKSAPAAKPAAAPKAKAAKAPKAAPAQATSADAERQKKQQAREAAKQEKLAKQEAALAKQAEEEAARVAAIAAEAETANKRGYAEVMMTPGATMRTRRPGPSLGKFKDLVKEMK